METLRARCEVDDCEWCAQSGVPCRCCGVSGVWVIGWIRVVEMCRMCGGTGKEHNPL